MGETPQDVALARKRREKLAILKQTRQLNYSDSTALHSIRKPIYAGSNRKSCPGHPNGLRIFSSRSGSISEKTYYSTGGGFIYSEEELTATLTESKNTETVPFHSMPWQIYSLMVNALSAITTMLRANENCHCSNEELNAGIDNIKVMKGASPWF